MYRKLLTVCIVVLMGMTLFACENANNPNENELVKDGFSLKEALPTFKVLKDNYSYRLKQHQTNGEDWFRYHIVKLYDQDVYQQYRRYDGNAGWQIEEEAFTFDPELNPYTIYLKTDGNYVCYSKYRDAFDENIFYYTSYTYDFDHYNELAQDAHFDFSFLKESWFVFGEAYQDDTQEGQVWLIKEDALYESDVQESILENMGRTTDFDQHRIDLFFIYVKDNQVTKMRFSQWNQYLQERYIIDIYFSYDDYAFDKVGLTAGFTPFIPDEN